MTRAGWTFRRVTRNDFPLLGAWLAQPEVHRWWQHEWSAEALERDFGPSVDGAEPSEDWLALLAGRPMGVIQRSRVSDYQENADDFAALGDVPPGALTIDYLLGETRGHGHGTAMLAAFVEQTWTDRPETETIVVSVVAANRPSWRALQRAGFRIVGQGDCEPENPEDDPLHYLLRVDRALALELVEGASDVAAVRAVIRGRGVDPATVEIRSLGGATNVRRAVEETNAAHPDRVM